VARVRIRSTAARTSRRLTAHTSHWDCVTITSGRSSSKRAASTAYTDVSVWSVSFTRRSMSALDPVTANLGDVQAGRRRITSG
jgi:hypothetical protein